MASPRLAVVVPTRDRADQLATCLASVGPQLQPGDELVVADSASAQAHQVAAVAAAAGATLVRCDRPGASRARNAGWRATTAPWVVFLDDDMQVLPGWAAALRGVSGLPGVGFATGHTLAPEGREGEAASVTLRRPPEVLDLRTSGPVGASNNLAVARAALEAVGGFDERLGPGTWLQAGEDLELLDRVLEAGWTGRYLSAAQAVHEQWRTAPERRRLELAYGKGMGARVAAGLRRRPVRGLRRLPDALRLGGLLTLVRRFRPGPAPVSPAGRDRVEQLDQGGWLLPLLWRFGALVGLTVGLVVLRPRRGSLAQVPVDDAQPPRGAAAS